MADRGVKREKRKAEREESASSAALRSEIERLRKAIRKHRDAANNARCWHNDLALYGALPEGVAPGKMTDPEEVLLRNCRRYIRRQQCRLDCPVAHKKRR